MAQSHDTMLHRLQKESFGYPRPHAAQLPDAMGFGSAQPLPARSKPPPNKSASIKSAVISRLRFEAVTGLESLPLHHFHNELRKAA